MAYDPKRPRPEAAPDLDALLGAGPSDPEPVAPEPVTPEPVASDPAPGTARHALPRQAPPLDQRVSRLLPVAPVVGLVVLWLVVRWWRRRR